MSACKTVRYTSHSTVNFLRKIRYTVYVHHLQNPNRHGQLDICLCQQPCQQPWQLGCQVDQQDHHAVVDQWEFQINRDYIWTVCFRSLHSCRIEDVVLLGCGTGSQGNWCLMVWDHYHVSISKHLAPITIWQDTTPLKNIYKLIFSGSEDIQCCNLQAHAQHPWKKCRI